MKCRRCGSEDINFQRIAITKRKRKGLLYWLLFGWVWEILLFIFWTIPYLIIKLLFPKKVNTKVHTEAVCQNCGYSWRA